MELPTYEHALDQAAEIWGIQPQYWDIWGRPHVTSAETKRAILESFGVRADSAEAVIEALEARWREQSSRLLPPCLVISENQRPVEIPIGLPQELEGCEARMELRLEDGSADVWQVAIGEIPVWASAEFDSRRYTQRLLPLTKRLPLGYHELEVAIGNLRASMPLIVAPDRAYLPEGLRAAGIAIALYSVRSGRSSKRSARG